MTAKTADLSKELMDGIHKYLQSDAYKTLLNTMSHFHRYSLNNSILIALQTDGKATQVASFTAWKALGRTVNKGEKGIKIFAPLPYRQKAEVPSSNGIDAVKPDDNGKTVLHSVKATPVDHAEITRMGFKVAYTFDISQTSGKPLPEIAPRLTGSVDGYQDLLTAVRDACPVAVVIGPVEHSSALGYYSPSECEVRIRENISELQTLKTMIHETAHARLHAAGTDGAAFSREDKEIQAESVAYIVCAHYRLDTSDYSFPYVANWAAGDEKQVMHNLQIIKDASDAIIRSVDQTLERLSLERQDRAVYKYAEGYLALQRQEDGAWYYERFGIDYQSKISGSIVQAGLRVDQAATKAAFQLGYTGAMQQIGVQDFFYQRSIAQIEQNSHHMHH